MVMRKKILFFIKLVLIGLCFLLYSREVRADSYNAKKAVKLFSDSCMVHGTDSYLDFYKWASGVYASLSTESYRNVKKGYGLGGEVIWAADVDVTDVFVSKAKAGECMVFGVVSDPDNVLGEIKQMIADSPDMFREFWVEDKPQVTMSKEGVYLMTLNIHARGGRINHKIYINSYIVGSLSNFSITYMPEIL